MHYGMCVSMGGGGALAPSAPPLDPPLCGDEDHCQDVLVDNCGDEDHCQYHLGIDHCQTGNCCQDRELSE